MHQLRSLAVQLMWVPMSAIPRYKPCGSLATLACLAEHLSIHVDSTDHFYFTSAPPRK